MRIAEASSEVFFLFLIFLGSSEETLLTGYTAEVEVAADFCVLTKSY